MKKDWMIKESELDDYQIKVLTETLDKSCVVSGCAGSGKSVLGLIKAQRIERERGGNYQIVVYTKALCQYMETGRKELGLTRTFYYHWEWKNRVHMPHADYLIVDEIQDFTADEIREFLNATGKCFFFFGDTAQSLYEGIKETVDVEDIGWIVPRDHKVKTWELYFNYRLPLPVAHVVQTVGVGLPPFLEGTYKSPETEMPRFLKYNNREEQMQAIHNIIERKDLTDVAILLPDNESVRHVYEQLRNLGGNYEQKYESKQDWHNSRNDLNFSSSNPKVMTYHSAKGLQFETVFLPYIENFSSSESSRKALYVAMTRTYRNLYVMYHSELPFPLSEVQPSLYKTTENDKIEDL